MSRVLASSCSSFPFSNLIFWAYLISVKCSGLLNLLSDIAVERYSHPEDTEIGQMLQ